MSQEDAAPKPPDIPRRFPVPLPGLKGREIGEDFLRFFIESVDLVPTEAVLEPGCGTGRIAEPLTRYLTTGSYDGFDVVATAIEWCEANISHPNFRFRHVDVFNRYYNPEGQLAPETFEFPYPAGSFDLVFVTSVFTHMLPPEVRHYLNEIRRVLRPTGRCVATLFLLDEEGARIARDTVGPKRVFAYEGDGYRYDVAGDPEAAIGYHQSDVLRFLEQAGFELRVPIFFDQQDVVVVAPT